MNYSTASVTSPVTIVIEGDAVWAKFLKQGDIVIVNTRQYTIGIARCDSDELVTFSVVNIYGGIEAITFLRDEFVQLATEV